MELSWGYIGFGTKVLFDCLQVHGLFNDLEIVWDVEGDWIHRSFEWPGASMTF